MSNTASARAPVGLDQFNGTLRRGFLDVHTPIASLGELQMPIAEQREFLKGLLIEIQAEREAIWVRLGKPNRGNFNYYTNTKPRKRLANRSGRTEYNRDADRFLVLGRRHQEIQQMLARLKRSAQTEFAAREK